MAQIILGSERFGCYLITNLETDEDILVQTDFDHPGLASSFGYVACKCGETDGTVDCPHKTAGEMIIAATEYLDNNLGMITDDPGYF